MRRYILILSVFILCCSSSKDLNVDSKSEVHKVITDYIANFSQYNTFILRSYQYTTNDSIAINGYFLAPAYEDILQESSSSLYMDLDDKRVYCLDFPINQFLRISDTKWNNMNPEDSILLNDRIIRDAWSLFIHRSIFFYYSNNLLEVNNRPDTIFTPKYIPEMSIPFNNLKM